MITRLQDELSTMNSEDTKIAPCFGVRFGDTTYMLSFGIETPDSNRLPLQCLAISWQYAQQPTYPFDHAV